MAPSESSRFLLGLPPNDGMAPQCTCPECSKYAKVENYYYVLSEVPFEKNIWYLFDC